MGLRIYLVATPTLGAGIQQFLDDRRLTWDRERSRSDAESLVEAAGRICYLSFGERQYRRGNLEYVTNLIDKGHESVFEHANFSLLVDGISRALSHQLVRHRIGFAYSQLSQQYKDEIDADFAVPPGLEKNPHGLERWREFMEEARKLYGELLQTADSSHVGTEKAEQRRWARSIARSVLPNATATTMMVTGNARAWRHLFDVRGDIAGDLEMRAYCVAAFRILAESAPSLFSDYEVVTDIGDCSVRKRRPCTG